MSEQLSLKSICVWLRSFRWIFFFKDTFMTFLWSWSFLSFGDHKTHQKKKKKKRCFSLSLFRSLGLPLSPSCSPSRVWKPPRDQLHRAAERAGSPPARPHTTRGHKIWCRKPARSKPWGTSTCVTAASESFCHSTNKNIYIFICEQTCSTLTHTHNGACMYDKCCCFFSLFY